MGIVGVMSVCVVGVVGVVGVVFTVSIGYLLCDLFLFLATNTRVSWVPFETSARQRGVIIASVSDFSIFENWMV